MESWEIPYTVGDDEAIERIKNALSRYMQIIGESENALTVIPKPVPSASITVKDGKSVRARRVKNTAFDSNIAFELPTKNGAITLSDYAQAGKNFDDDDTGITVWMDVVK